MYLRDMGVRVTFISFHPPLPRTMLNFEGMFTETFLRNIGMGRGEKKEGSVILVWTKGLRNRGYPILKEFLNNFAKHCSCSIMCNYRITIRRCKKVFKAYLKRLTWLADRQRFCENCSHQID